LNAVVISLAGTIATVRLLSDGVQVSATVAKHVTLADVVAGALCIISGSIDLGYVLVGVYG
jgi:hypothetical protein